MYMTRQGWFACCLLACLAAVVPSVAPAAEPADWAHGVWVITDTVLEHHIDPPARQQMLLDAVKALLAKSGTPVPTDLPQRVSRVTTEDQFAAFLRDIWPNVPTAEFKFDEILYDNALASVPGRPHYIPADQLKVQQASSANRYVGIGIQISKNDKEELTQIVLPFPGGAARKAGSKPGDLIVEVDGENMKGRTVMEVVKKLRGEEGTTVTVVVRQPGATEARTLKMVRAVVPFTSVAGFRRTGEESWDFRVDPDQPIAYLRVSAISISTLHELRKLERQLLADGTRAVVLDLRGNPGGGLDYAALVADGLLDTGLLWKVRDKQGRVKEYKADRDCLFRDCRVAVLVDENTASAAALVAAALQDNGRAILVGEKSRSFGIVRSQITLPGDLGGTDLITATVERAKPTPPAKAEAEDEETASRPRGFHVEPDHLVKMESKQKEALVKWMREQDLPEPPANAEKNPPEDPQLAKALALLREGLKATESSEKPAAKAKSSP
jgi:carboxyl-terminal processing protease